MMKNNLIALLDQTYPDVNALFDSPVREDVYKRQPFSALDPMTRRTLQQEMKSLQQKLNKMCIRDRSWKY